MLVTSRHAEIADLSPMFDLYRSLEAEMVALKPVWRLTEGLPEPIVDALRTALEDTDTTVIVGEIDRYPLGFLIGREEALLPHANASVVAAVRYVFTDPEAREVGVGEAMLDLYLEERRAAGVRLFDAHVSPGHRMAKNFFESNGFKARHIVMHHDADAS